MIPQRVKLYIMPLKTHGNKNSIHIGIHVRNISGGIVTQQI